MSRPHRERESFVTKRVKERTDVTIKKILTILLGQGKRMREYEIIDEAVRLYYAYVLGLIPDDVVYRALEELMALEEVGRA